MIMGYGRHGKDTVAEYLRDKYGFTFQSSSLAAAEAIFPLLKVLHGYTNPEGAFNHRHGNLEVMDEGCFGGTLHLIENRQIWYEAIALLNKGDPTTLAKEIYSKSDIYVGIRSLAEFQKVKAKRMFDLSIWVDASERVPPEGRASCTVSKEDADIIITNNHSLEHLYDQIDNLVQKSIIRAE
jgi:hypothetical protein